MDQNLYDEADPASGASTFTFDIADQSGPHFPLEIVGDPQFERFDPSLTAYQLERNKRTFPRLKIFLQVCVGGLK